jgi:hypothetical protein
LEDLKKSHSPRNNGNKNGQREKEKKETNDKNRNKQSSVLPKERIKTGESIARILTGMWSSQKNPGKVYVRGYRVHHGAVGFIGALASAYLKSPAAYGFFKHLMEDDHDDWQEWFSGERLSDNHTSSTS